MANLEKFVQDILESKVVTRGTIVDPKDQDFVALSQSHDQRKHLGTYTLNPEIQDVDFERFEMWIPDLSAFLDVPIYKVLKHVVDTFGEKYRFPDITYMGWLHENPDRYAALKDGNDYFFPGSLIGGGGGYWCLPFVAWWEKTRLDRRAIWIRCLWATDSRIVLLKKK